MARATASRTASPGPKHNIEAMRQEYYQRIAKHSMTPLWKVMESVVTREPVTHCVPVIWHLHDYISSRPIMSRLLRLSARRFHLRTRCTTRSKNSA